MRFLIMVLAILAYSIPCVIFVEPPISTFLIMHWGIFSGFVTGISYWGRK